MLRRTSHSVTAAVIAALLLASTAAWGKRVVVLGFSGPQAGQLASAVQSALETKHTLVTPAQVAKARKRVGARGNSERDLRDLAAELDADAFVSGSAKRQGPRLVTTVVVRAGRGGAIVGSREVVVRGNKLDGKARRELGLAALSLVARAEGPAGGGRSSERDRDGDDDRAASRNREREEPEPEPEPVPEPKVSWDDEDDSPLVPGAPKKKPEPPKVKPVPKPDPERLVREARAKRDREDREREDRQRERDREDRDREDRAREDRQRERDREDRDRAIARAREDRKDRNPDDRDRDDRDRDRDRDRDDRDRVDRDRADRDRVDRDRDDADRDRDPAPAPDAFTRADLVERYSRRPMAEVSAGVSFVGRTLEFVYDPALVGEQKPNGYQGSPVAGTFVTAEIYPLAKPGKSGALTGLGGTFHFDRVLVLKSRLRARDASGMTVTRVFDTAQTRWGLGARYRRPLGTRPTHPTLELDVGYGGLSFVVDNGDIDDDFPDVTYSLIEVGGGLRLPVGTPRVALHPRFKYLHVLSAGEITDPSRYGEGAPTGLALDVALEVRATLRLVMRAGVSYTRFAFDFGTGGDLAVNRDGDPNDQDVGGALDVYLGGYLTVGYTF